MARDILSEYGNNISKPQRARATTGGVKSAGDVNSYRSPTGPTNINDTCGPGLHGTNHGNGQKCYATSGSGSPGLHGDNRRKGTQRG
jgi:hypothetical protein